MALKLPSFSKWSENQSILAVLTGVLAATVIVIVVSAVLHPVNVGFSVVDASVTAGRDFFNLTLAANNPSHRTGVKYGSINVVLRIATDRLDFVSRVEPAPPFRQPPWNTTTVHAATPSNPQMLAFAQSSGFKFDVLVTAEVQFMVGVACTRPYTVEVSCNDVDFTSFKPVNCTG